MTVRGIVSYWVLPIISGLVWMGMLLGMLLSWIIDDNAKRLPTMSQKADIAFISHIGAGRLQPLFIAGCVLTVVFLDAAFIAERWLRHNGRLLPNSSISEKVLSILSLLFAIVGTVGLICLSIYETGAHKRVHNISLGLFIGGYLFSAICLCWEYQRMGIKNRDHRKLRLSFWVKLVFILVELSLVIVFGVCVKTRQRNYAAVFEWIIAFIFSFYAFSFTIDLYPAVHTRNRDSRYTRPINEKPQEGSTSNESRNDSHQRDAEMV